MRYQINLLPNRENNFTDRLIYFSFHYLRYILVITQLVVISVFFYRFQIDQQVVDLKDSIKQKSEIIQVSASLLSDVKAIDTKIQSISRAADEQRTIQSMYDYFFATFPADLYLTSIDLSTKGIALEGYTSNIQSIKLYQARLLQDKKFEQVELINIQKDSLVYIFSFNLNNFTK